MSYRIRRTWTAPVLAAATGALALVSAPSAATAAAAPGQLLSVRPAVADALPGVALPARAWHITYRSTTATGGGDIVGATVLVPDAAYDGARPLVGFAVGTQGLADRCAPSAQLAAGTEYEAPVILGLLARGFAVAVTDYPGLGTAGQHPYVMGRALGPAVLDSIRAARHLRAAGLPAHGPAAVMGYSEGGGAAAWAAQLQPTYAPDVPLAGAAVGGVPANLPATGRSLDGGAFSFLLGYTAIGLQAAYPHLDIAGLLTPTGRRYLAALKTSCIEDASLDYPPYTPSSAVTTTDVLAVPAIHRALVANSLGRTAPTTPVLMQQVATDEVLPYAPVVTLEHRWCARGTSVQFVTEAAVDHLSGGFVAAPLAISWLDDRFHARALHPTC